MVFQSLHLYISQKGQHLREKSDLSILACYRARRRVGVREKLDFLADAFEDGRLVWVVDMKDGWKDYE